MRQPTVKPRGLVLGSDLRIALAIARCLGRHGVDIDVAFPSNMRCRSRHIGLAHKIRPLDDEAAADDLRRLIDEYTYEAVIPCNDLALALCAKHRASFTERCQLYCPQPEVVMSVLDKDQTLAAAVALGINIPFEPSLPNSPDPARVTEFPIIAKPRNKAERSAARIHYLGSAQDLAALGQRTDEFIFQEYVPGVGVGVEILMHDSDPLVIFQHQREEELPSTGGVSVLARAVPADPDLVEQAVALLRKLSWQGVAMVEFRQDLVTGRAVLMEVNGRYWGSLALSLEAGLEFPWYEWQLNHGGKPELPKSYNVGTRIAWTAGRCERLIGYVRNRPPAWIYRSTITRELIRFARYLPPFTRDVVWRVGDLSAGLSEIEQVALKAAGMLPLSFKKFLKLSSNAAKFEYLRGWIRPTAPRHLLPTSILVVCQGNIIRSAFAAALLRQACGGSASVESAGTHATQSQADQTAMLVAQEFAIDLSRHVPQPVTHDMIANAVCVFAMDRFNEAELRSTYPSARAKICLLGSNIEVRDPWGQDHAEFRACFEQIKSHVDQVVAQRAGAVFPAD